MKEHGKKLSIIVPNYKNEQYLDRSISYLINQSYKNVEIIIVNDGSPKELGCDKIVKEFQKKDKRIKYVKYEANKGLFHARLAGADVATGDYIAFLDADDYASIDFYRTLIENAEKNNSDIVIGNTVLEFPEKDKYEYPLLKFNFNELKGDEILDNYFDQRGYNYSWYTIWNKIYSMDIWKKARKHYDDVLPPLIMTEDISFSTVLFYYAKKITRVQNDAIFYCQNESSSTAVSTLGFEREKRSINDIIKSFTFVEQFMKNVKIYEKYKDLFLEWKKVFATHHKELVLSIPNDKDNDKEQLLDLLSKLSEEFGKKNQIGYFYSIRTKWDERLEDIKKKIIDDDVKYVSFDIFDTLLLRPFYFPTDLFRMLDKYFIEISGKNSVAFSKIRMESEFAARSNKQNSSSEDVTLDEIYDTMQTLYEADSLGRVDKKTFLKMKEKEIEYEIRFSSARKTAQELYQLALDHGKKVICISDMYLPKEVIQKMLKKNGYDIDRVYISSEIMKTKATGSLYDYVIKDLNVTPETMIHIGDNYESDFVNPQKYGMKAIHFIKTIDALWYANELTKMFTFCLPFWEDNRESMRFLGVRTMIAVFANKYFDNPFRSFNHDTDFNADPYLIGYYALGMYNYAITRWLLDNTNGVDDVIAFMARDGYLCMETYDILKELYDKPAKSVYMYASRKALIPVIIENKFDFYKLTDILYFANTNPKKVAKYLKYVMDIDNNELKKICLKENIGFEENFKSVREFNRYLTILADTFFDEKKHSVTRNKIKKYFDGILGDRTAIFDVGYSGRPEYYLKKLCNKEVDTYFLNVNSDEAHEYSNIGDFTLKTFFSAKPTLTGNAYELLLSKIAPSCIGYDTSKDKAVPVFEKFNNDYIVDHIVDVMQKAAIEFTKDLYTIFGKEIKLLYYQDYYLTLPIMAYFNSSEKLDKDILGAVVFEDDIGFGISRKMIDEMTNEGNSKNQKILKELLHGVPAPEPPVISNEILDKNLRYNKATLSKHNRLYRLMYYTLFDKNTFKRRVREIKTNIRRKNH